MRSRSIWFRKQDIIDIRDLTLMFISSQVHESTGKNSFSPAFEHIVSSIERSIREAIALAFKEGVMHASGKSFPPSSTVDCADLIVLVTQAV